jgi:2-methylcitrate dehydratase PrpD
VPAALAVGELHDCAGQDLIRAIVAGYDVGARVAEALGGDRFFDLHHSSHSFGGLFAATAAATALAAPGRPAVAAAALSYAVQLASGNSCWRRDPDHVEKAFDFGGMPAHSGVLAARMAAAGFTGSSRPLEGTPGLFAAFPREARPALATEALGERYEIMRTAIKKWAVGSPIQAALDSLESLMAAHGFSAADVDDIVVSLPKQSAPVVDNRDMPAVCLQHQLALMLLDGTVTFASGHDLARMADRRVAELRKKIRIEPRPEPDFIEFPRQAIVEVTLAGGRRVTQRTLHVRGTPQNPMTAAEVVAKARDLVDPVLGAVRGTALVDTVLAVGRLPSVRQLAEAIACGGTGLAMQEAVPWR